MLRLFFFLNWIGALTFSLPLKLPQENWKLGSFYEVSFSWGCSLSLLIYQTNFHGIFCHVLHLSATYVR